jgi:enterobactin synthetase component F
VLEHLGRLDHVVKIAGNRVDLAEIETALTALVHITDAVATTYVDDAGELRLRAFVVVGSHTLWNVRSIRGQLSKQLARPLLPDFIDVLDELPRLPNGKVDRQGLPTTAPRLTAPWLEATRPPTEQLERELATLWEKVLGVDVVGLDDDFFDLGGDSFRAVRLAELVTRELGIEMPAWMLIEHPTIAGLAASLDHGSPTNRVVTIQAAVEGTPIFVAHDNFGNLFAARNFLTAGGLEQPVYGLRAAAWEGRPVGGTLQEVAAEQVDDILSVQPAGPVLVYGQDTGTLFAFEIARQLLACGAEVPLLVIAGRSGPPLPLVPGPARVLALVRSLATLPGREVPKAIARVALGKGVQLSRRLGIRAHPKVEYTREDGEPLTADVDHALQVYGAMAQHYRPPSHYPGPVLLIKPSWIIQPIEDRWKYWVDGPLRVANVEELRTDLFRQQPRRLESLAPSLR